jgi:hypothetical protein
MFSDMVRQVKQIRIEGFRWLTLTEDVTVMGIVGGAWSKNGKSLMVTKGKFLFGRGNWRQILTSERPLVRFSVTRFGWPSPCYAKLAALRLSSSMANISM